MRRLVSRYTKRYMDSRKYRKQLVAEEAVRRVKRAQGKGRARFLKRVGRENYWEEVDDRIACDKVSHALRCFVRKLEEGGEPLVSDADDDSVGEEESDTEEVPPSAPQESKDLLSSSMTKALEKSASGLDALKRLNHIQPLSLMPLSASVAPAPLAASLLPTPSGSLKLSGMLQRLVTPPMPAGITGGFGLPISAAEVELDYRMSLQRMSTRGLMDLVAVERVQRTPGGSPPPTTDPLASSLTSIATASMEQQLLQQRLLNRARMQELISMEKLVH